MQAVVDNFPIILTALLLSLALCWWGLSHYVIASKRLEKHDTRQTDPTQAHNQQFATRQAVSRSIRNDIRISAELKSVAALQTRIRQKHLTRQTADTIGTNIHISTARLDIAPTLASPGTAKPAQRTDSARQSTKPVQSTNASQGTKPTKSTFSLQNQASFENSSSLQNSGSSQKTRALQRTDSSQNTEPSQSDTEQKGSLTTAAKHHNTSSDQRPLNRGNVVADSVTDNPENVVTKASNNSQTSHGTNSSDVAKKKQAAKAVDESPRIENSTVLATDVTTDAATEDNVKAAKAIVEIEGTIDQQKLVATSSSTARNLPSTRTANSLPGQSSAKNGQSSVDKSAKSTPEKIHHATSSANVKITPANKPLTSASNRQQRKPEETESQQSTVPKIAAYKMPRADIGAVHNPLTEIKTGADGDVEVDVDSQKNTSRATTNSVDLDKVSAGEGTKPSTEAPSDAPTSTLISKTPEKTAQPSTSSAAEKTETTAPSTVTSPKPTTAISLTKSTDGEVGKSDDKAVLQEAPSAAPTTTSTGPAVTANAGAGAVSSQQDKTPRADSEQPGSALFNRPTQPLPTAKANSATDSKRFSQQTNPSPSVDASKKKAPQLPGSLTGFNANNNNSNSNNKENAQKYQTAAKLKQMPPSHEAQLQVKPGDITAPAADTHSQKPVAEPATEKTGTPLGKPSESQHLDVAETANAPALQGNAQPKDDTTAKHSPAAFSGADELESTLALEAKDQLIAELTARVADLEARDKPEAGAATAQDDSEDYKRQLSEAAEKLKLSDQKVGKLQSSLQALQSRTSHTPLAPAKTENAPAHNRALLSSKVRILDIKTAAS